jgi:aminopeptidase-like protein
MCSLTRYPYSEYHSSLDNAEAMDEHALDEAARVIELAIDELETTRLVTKLFTGTTWV